jgi:hypothetical protein
MFLIFQGCIDHREMRIHISEKIIQISERATIWKHKKKLKYYLCKNLKGTYSGFIPLDLNKMVVYWENINLFE